MSKKEKKWNVEKVKTNNLKFTVCSLAKSTAMSKRKTNSEKSKNVYNKYILCRFVDFKKAYIALILQFLPFKLKKGQGLDLNILPLIKEVESFRELFVIIQNYLIPQFSCIAIALDTL